jgi:hypothetical protein
VANPLIFHKIIPIFVGGTGRSGTTVMGDLLGEHEDIRTSLPIEIKFLANRNGLLDLTFGRGEAPVKVRNDISIFNFRTRRKRRAKEAEKVRAKFAEIEKEFIDQLWQKWWDIDAPPPHGRGLQSGIERKKFEKLLSRLLRDLKFNRIWAARRFMKAFVKGQRDSGSERYWVETTPLNIAQADKLLHLFPNALFINMVRDPRDVIASLLTKNWGPNTPAEGLEWIEKRLIDGHLALSKIPDRQKITIALEDLAIANRQVTYSSILKFLQVEDSASMQSFFNSQLTPENATSGRWADEIASPEFNAGYEAIVSKLNELGVRFR